MKSLFPQQNKTKKKKRETVKQSRKKEIKFLDVMIICILIFLLIFVSVTTYMSYKTMYEPTTLIASVFAFCGLEYGLMSSITKRKMILKDKDYGIKNPKNQDQNMSMIVPPTIDESLLNQQNIDNQEATIDEDK